MSGLKFAQWVRQALLFVRLARGGLLFAMVLGCFVACASGVTDEQEETLGVSTEALTFAEVWGMENASGWTVVTGTATKQASTIRSQGSFSLQLTSSAFVGVRGDAVAKPAAVSPLLAVDVMVPTQAGPYYWGAVQMTLDIPSLGLNGIFLGQKDLTQPTGVFQTLHFQIPSSAYAQVLSSSFSDLQITIGVNEPQNLNQPYRLDNLRFVPMPGCVGVPDGTLCEDSATCTTGSSCTGGICGTVTTVPPGSACDAGDDVMGFENFPAWQTTNGSAALAPSTTRVQGERSLQITTPFFMTVGSINLATLHKVSQTLSLRVRKPTHQPNSSWHGDLTLNLVVPSLGINFSATRNLTGQPNGSFFELTFAIPTALYQQLAAQTYSDLRFLISVNPPNGQSGFYLLDDLRFVPVTSCSGIVNNTACEDGSACTQGDRCLSGTCGVPVVCDDTNLCTNDSCNPATGCVFTNNTNPCNDSNACTTADTCSGGACVGGPPLPCNDANGCTTDTCNPASGCVFTNNTDSCTDGNACTAGDQCSGGACIPGGPASCEDGNPCTDDICVAPTGCVHVNTTSTCTDHNACTGVDTSGTDVCSGGVCVSGPPVSCDDGSNCTQDTCDGGSGCVNNFICGVDAVCFANNCCTPNSCLGLHAECGVRDTGCGSTIDCGTCPTGGTCNPAGRCLRPNDFDEPTGINVCEILLEQLIIPPTFEDVLTCEDHSIGECLNPFSGVPPDCCVPGLCLLNPLCTFFNPVQLTAEIIFNPGDVYCSVTMTAEEYFDRLLQGRLNDLAALSAMLSTGGLNLLFDFDVQVMTAAGRQAPDHVRNLIRALTDPIYDGGATGFSYDDLDGVKIVSSDFPTAGLYLPGERAAITLGPVIVLKAKWYDALFGSGNSGVTYEDFLTDLDVCDRYTAAVDILIHELVHVHQYAELGRYNFYAQYLGSAIVNEYGDIGFEEEAFDYHIRLAGLQGGRYCSVMEKTHNDFITGFTLATPVNTCPSDGIHMRDFPACP